MEPNSLECPDCGAQKPLSTSMEIGQLISCQDCGARLELLSISPPSIGHAPQIEEDFGE